MPGVNRVELPAEFYDKTSDHLLIQPEPQYFYAGLWKTAQRASLAIPSEMGLMGRGVSGTGADYSTADRDRLMLSNPVAVDTVATPNNNMSGLPGHTLRFNRPKYTDSTYTETSRRIGTSATISTTPIGVDSEQAALTLRRYAGPFDNANSEVRPYGIDALDATLGVHKLSSIVGTHLTRDHDRFLDTVQVQLLDLAATTVRPNGMAADNDATTQAMFPTNYAHINDLERQMDDANIPVFADGFRALVAHPVQCQQWKNDPQFARYAEFHPEYNALFPNYIKSVNKFHIFKSTTLTTAVNGSSVNIFRAHGFGPEPLLGGFGRPGRVAPSTDDNYGETAKVVWIADYGFGLANDTLVFLFSSAGE